MEETQVLSLYVQKPGKNCIGSPELTVIVGLFDKVRHTWEGLDNSDSKYPLNELYIQATVHIWSAGDVSVSHEFFVRALYLKNSREAARCVALLTKMEKGLERIASEMGYAATFGTYVARIAKVLGVKVLVFTDEQYDTIPAKWATTGGWTQAAYRSRKPGDAVWKIDQYICEMKGETK